MSQSGAEKEIVIGNKQLISLFFVVVALCGVFFAMGYMVRGNSLKGTVSAGTGDAGSAPADTVKRQQPEPPSETADPAAAPAASEATAEPSPEQTATETRPAQDVTPAPDHAASLPYETGADTKPAKPESAPSSSSVSELEPGASYVQVGALPRSDAESTARTLREQHLPALIALSSKEGLYRVVVGPYHHTADVADVKTRLKTLGFSNTIVVKQAQP